MNDIGSIVGYLVVICIYGLIFYSAYKGLKRAIYKSKIRRRRASMKLIKGEKKDV